MTQYTLTSVCKHLEGHGANSAMTRFWPITPLSRKLFIDGVSPALTDPELPRRIQVEILGS